jgi:predicted P-loop ATPase
MGTPLPSDTLYKKLRAYVENYGFSVLPLMGLVNGVCECSKGKDCGQTSGKHPKGSLARAGVHSASADPSNIRFWVDQNLNGNWGIATGLPLKQGGYLIVLDVDPRNGGDQTLADLLGKHGPLPDTLRANTGGGGQHYYFWTKDPMPSRSAGPGLDVKATPGYVVCDPSLHLSGQRYEWDAGAHPDDLVEIKEAPRWITDGADLARSRPDPTGTLARNTLLGKAFENAGMIGNNLANGSVMVQCPWVDEHSDGRGDGKDSSTVILPPIDGTSFGSFSCSHGHCVGQRKWSDVLKALPAAAVAAAQQQFPLKPQIVKTDPNASSIAPTPIADPVWNLFAYKKTKSGSIIKSDFVNTVTMLTHDRQWNGVLKFDEFNQSICFAKPPPWHPDDMPAVQEDLYSDADTTRIVLYAQRTFDMNIPSTMAEQAAYVVAHHNKFNPVRDWLETLKWDGKPRVEKWTATYLGCEDNIYSAKVGKWWLLAAVARVMEPGCKVDNLIILEGPQGARKSTALRTLAYNPRWFSDTPFTIGTKDAFQVLRGRWIIELAELDTLNRSEASKSKAFLSSSYDTYRPSYARHAVQIPRMNVFCGSVNQETYLQDETGNRRFWPLTCGKIDTDRLELDVVQLWAEALHLYKAGHKWYPEAASDYLLTAEQQEMRVEPDEIAELIVNWIKSPTGAGIMERRTDPDYPNGWLATSDIATHVLKLEPSLWTKLTQMRIARVLKLLGYRKKRVVNGMRFYKR